MAAFEKGELPEDAQVYARDVFRNTPITLEGYGFDNYFYKNDNRGTVRDPIEITLDNTGIKASLVNPFEIRLPLDNLPPEE